MDGDNQCETEVPRILTAAEQEKLANDVVTLSAFKQGLLEKEAMKNWDLFYRRNTTCFYKDRHWTHREFPELNQDRMVLLEAGCGVGNFIYPLLETNSNLFIYACDFSKRAVEYVQENPMYDPSRCKAFQYDLTQPGLTESVPADSVDACSLIFVLSAIHPDKMSLVLSNIQQVLKPGGAVLIRDYGLHDHAMLRFKPGHKLAENLYRRQDNTRAYYYTLEKLDELFKSVGYEVEHRVYIHRRTVNKKEEIDVPRVFVQGRYIKPVTKYTIPTTGGGNVSFSS